MKDFAKTSVDLANISGITETNEPLMEKPVTVEVEEVEKLPKEEESFEDSFADLIISFENCITSNEAKSATPQKSELKKSTIIEIAKNDSPL